MFSDRVYWYSSRSVPYSIIIIYILTLWQDASSCFSGQHLSLCVSVC
jgi:hypothetical protein